MSAPAPSASEPQPACPIDAAAFARLIAPLGPFEARPHLAAAVSGGPDSMALCLLATRWARARGGRVTALVVDHGLRPSSAQEARTVGGWLTARGIDHEILTWLGPKPRSGIQAAARAARYGLLGERCRTGRILHLLVGHQREDQAETVALRRAAGSGPDGLAGIPAVRELPGFRLLRPLLAVARADLQATLVAEGQPWLEDPSNRAPGFARARLRAGHGLDAAALGASARRQARARAALDADVAPWLVACTRIHRLGYVTISAPALRAAPPPVARRILLQSLATVGGRAYGPREARLLRLVDALRQGHAPARTLAGCRVLPGPVQILICREPAAITDVLPLERGWRRWDNRFELRCASPSHDSGAAPFQVRALGEEGWRARRTLMPERPGRAVPAPVGPGLPAVWRGDRLLLVPQLGLAAPEVRGLAVLVRLRPGRPLCPPRFGVPPG